MLGPQQASGSMKGLELQLYINSKRTISLRGYKYTLIDGLSKQDSYWFIDFYIFSKKIIITRTSLQQTTEVKINASKQLALILLQKKFTMFSFFLIIFRVVLLG